VRAERIVSRLPGRDVRPRTLILEWTDPPMSGGHWTPGLVEIAGGFDLERARSAVSELAGSATWNALRAVRSGSAYAIDPNAPLPVPAGIVRIER
jgi:ABC-type Fe3+-hydroxamate transport system substrate-binding protein